MFCSRRRSSLIEHKTKQFPCPPLISSQKLKLDDWKITNFSYPGFISLSSRVIGDDFSRPTKQFLPISILILSARKVPICASYATATLDVSLLLVLLNFVQLPSFLYEDKLVRVGVQFNFVPISMPWPEYVFLRTSIYRGKYWVLFKFPIEFDWKKMG